MKDRELLALVWGMDAGLVSQDSRGKLRFTYEDRWRERQDAVALSVSMPLAAKEHGHDAIDAYLWGLLPDNEVILERWGRKFQVSARNAFALIGRVGEDCPGAVQLVPQDRAEDFRGPGREQVEWLEEKDVEDRLRALRKDQAAWRLAEDPGQFSLAGAQPKTALIRLDGRWGVPSGRTPTTHILKPPVEGLDGHAENEHVCLLLARESGLATATSEVRRFGSEIAIVVERYDRAHTVGLADAADAEAAMHAAQAAAAAAEAPTDPKAAARAVSAAAAAAEASARAESLRALARTQPILRLHQEDLCQALGVRPTLKYQNEGGPSPDQIVGLLREHSGNPEEDIAAFTDALAFNWLVGGTDGHAKNYSILHGSGGSVRLAPLYDLASALPYPEMNSPRVKLAMRIGGEYRLHRIHRGRWVAMAEELGLDSSRILRRTLDLAKAVVEAVPAVRARVAEVGLDHPIIGRLLDLVLRRSEDCVRDLEGSPPDQTPAF